MPGASGWLRQVACACQVRKPSSRNDRNAGPDGSAVAACVAWYNLVRALDGMTAAMTVGFAE